MPSLSICTERFGLLAIRSFSEGLARRCHSSLRGFTEFDRISFRISSKGALLSLASYFCSTPLVASIPVAIVSARTVPAIVSTTASWYHEHVAYTQLRDKARALRLQGKSIGRIAQTLAVSKSTVSYWCRDIKLSDKQVRLLAIAQRRGGALGRLKAAELKRAARISAIQKESERGSRAIGTLSKRDIFMLGLALYWGEGYKSGNEECGLTNGSPDIIRAFIVWLKKIYGIKSPDLILRVSINATHAHRVQEVEKYWSTSTKIPMSQFTKTSLIQTKAKKVYANQNDHFGTLRVKVRRATTLRRRILGSIAEVSSQFHSIYLNSLNA